MTADKVSSGDNPDIHIYNTRFHRILEQYYDTDGDFYLKCFDCKNYKSVYIEQYHDADGYCKQKHEIGYEGVQYCEDYESIDGLYI